MARSTVIRAGGHRRGSNLSARKGFNEEVVKENSLCKVAPLEALDLFCAIILTFVSGHPAMELSESS